jgi:S-DNA-T family DNA segregation ATPase FtsK/SpoIIIE
MDLRYHSRVNTPSKNGSPSKDLKSELGSVALFALALFTLCSLATYSPQDPGFFSSSSAAIQNACGRVGAYLASLFIQCFGLGSFLLPAAIGFVSATVYKREGKVRVIGTLGGMSIAAVSLTVFLSLQWKFWPYAGSLLLTGGLFGAWLADLLIQQFHSLGSSIVSLLVFCLALAWSTPVSVAKVGAQILSFSSKWIFKITQVLVTYLAYLLGMFLMRLAQFAGAGLAHFLETSSEKAQEYWLAMREAREARQSIQNKSTPVIGPDPTGPTREVKLPKGPGIQLPLPETEIHESVTMDTSPMVLVHSDAPNILDDINPILPGPSLTSAPEILPHDEITTGAAQAQVGASSKPVIESEAPKRTRVSRPRKQGSWKLPSLEFLKQPPKDKAEINREQLMKNSELLTQKFLDLGIEGEITAVRPGPVVTLYEFKPASGVKLSRIANMADDLSMALSAQSVRILAPIPGKSVVGIEIPSDKREPVFLREFIGHDDFSGTRLQIPVVMGKDIGGQPVFSDLARMPHLLVAGQTGSGKSVFMNGLINSLLYRFTPDELRMILIDPKFIEFSAYQDIPHLLLPVVDDPRNASTALKWAVREMERRYRILAMLGAKNLASYNEKVQQMGTEVVRDLLLEEQNQGEEQGTFKGMSGGDWMAAFETDEEGNPRIGKLPYVVVIIDELADLMMIAKKEVEVSIARIAQKARAAGIHLVVATQRPSTDVVTGLIKANLPSRASFQLASYIDSKTILDRMGAERLLGQGDMLFIPPGVSTLLRLHGAYLSDDEIEKVTSFLKAQGKPAYRDEILEDEDAGDSEGTDEDAEDDLYDKAVELVREQGHASASFLQRRFKVGYNRASRLIETMEMRGVVGPADGAKPREVFMR